MSPSLNATVFACRETQDFLFLWWFIGYSDLKYYKKLYWIIYPDTRYSVYQVVGHRSKIEDMERTFLAILSRGCSYIWWDSNWWLPKIQVDASVRSRESCIITIEDYRLLSTFITSSDLPCSFYKRRNVTHDEVFESDSLHRFAVTGLSVFICICRKFEA